MQGRGFGHGDVVVHGEGDALVPAEEILVCIRIVGAYGKRRACLLDLDGDLIAEVGRRVARGRGDADVRHYVEVDVRVGVDDGFLQTVSDGELDLLWQRV